MARSVDPPGVRFPLNAFFFSFQVVQLASSVTAQKTTRSLEPIHVDYHISRIEIRVQLNDMERSTINGTQQCERPYRLRAASERGFIKHLQSKGWLKHRQEASHLLYKNRLTEQFLHET